MVAVRVVELGLAQPHLHVGHAHMVGRAVTSAPNCARIDTLLASLTE
jgi:alpha-D-ribose 1-methylphosphonate 5-triphosphate synthase subunit PhnG